MQLQQKVQQLYELDEILQEESDNLHLLQRDKEDIEGALAELNLKFATDRVQSESFVTTKKIQHSLEVELSKIHHQLAANSRVFFFVIISCQIKADHFHQRHLYFIILFVQFYLSEIGTNRFGQFTSGT